MTDEARDNHAQQIERAEIANLVRSRMESLNLPGVDYDDVSEKRNSLSYVIINPSCDLKLEEGDIMWVLLFSIWSYRIIYIEYHHQHFAHFRTDTLFVHHHFQHKKHSSDIIHDVSQTYRSVRIWIWRLLVQLDHVVDPVFS